MTYCRMRCVLCSSNTMFAQLCPKAEILERGRGSGRRCARSVRLRVKECHPAIRFRYHMLLLLCQ
jgi:hypothetical protein